MYKERDPSEEPPCEDCRVEPLPENLDAIKIFDSERYQLIMGQGGPVDMNHSVIFEAMRLYKIKNRQQCYEKVLTLGRWWVSECNKKSE